MTKTKWQEIDMTKSIFEKNDKKVDVNEENEIS